VALTLRSLRNRIEGALFSDPEEIVAAIEDALAELSIGQWVKAFEEWIRRLRQCIDGERE
jgi:hypothetical protein